MLREVGPIVAARIEVKFVRNFLGYEEVVERLRTRVEAEYILGSTVKVNLHALGTRAIFNQSEGIVAVPECAIERRAESGA